MRKWIFAVKDIRTITFMVKKWLNFVFNSLIFAINTNTFEHNIFVHKPFEQKPFVIEGTTMRVKYNFDDSLEKYIANIKVLIFEENLSSYNFSSFNQPIVLTRCLTHVVFGFDFNQPIILNCHLTYVAFGYLFNQPIILNKYLLYIIFGSYFNQPIVLNSCLTHITFGYCFNHPIVLQPRLTHIKFGQKFNNPIVLNKRLKHVSFDTFCFNHPIILTPYLTHVALQFNRDFDQSIVLTQHLQYLTYLTYNCNNHWLFDNLPNSVRYLRLDGNFTLPLNNIPTSMKKITVANNYYKYKHMIQCLA